MLPMLSFLFFFNDTATTEIYTLSLHDALPICCGPCPRRSDESSLRARRPSPPSQARRTAPSRHTATGRADRKSTSELQSRQYLVCRLLLEKKKKPHSHLLPLSPSSSYTKA